MNEKALYSSKNYDTICAIATPHGIGGIAVVRLCGPKAFDIADTIWKGILLGNVTSHTAHLGEIVDPETGTVLDQAVATVFRSPHSYTGDDTVEFSVHGSRWIQSELLNILIANGARLAEPGEYTRRAFAAGHLDLAQAEAVADLIASDSRASHRIAVNNMRGGFSRRLEELREQLIQLASLLELELDFSEEDVEFASREQLLKVATGIQQEVVRLKNSFSNGAAIKNGIPVAIAGNTNAGKSSLLNRLLGEERAIVSDIHGTTRDTIEDTITIGDFRFRFIDTAGLRETSDAIEKLGINRSHNAISAATIVILVIDPTNPIDASIIQSLAGRADNPPAGIILTVNKTDVADEQQIQVAIDSTLKFLDTIPYPIEIVRLSARTGNGIDTLTETLTAIARQMSGTDDDSQILVTNARHAQALHTAAQSIERVIDGLHNGLSGDFIAQDLRETLQALGTITGTITTPEILSSIFTRFCIGK